MFHKTERKHTDFTTAHGRSTEIDHIIGYEARKQQNNFSTLQTTVE